MDGQITQMLETKGIYGRLSVIIVRLWRIKILIAILNKFNF